MKARRTVTLHLLKEGGIAHPWPWRVSSPDQTKKQRAYGDDVDDYVTRMSRPSEAAVIRTLIRCF